MGSLAQISAGSWCGAADQGQISAGSCCGSADQGQIKAVIPGARTMTPCLHVLTALHLAGVLSHNPREYKTHGANRNYIEGNDPLPGEHGGDILDRVYS